MHCPRVNNENTILATFEVISLYTNILHAYELEALSYWIDKHPGSLHKRFSKQFVLESARLILENNNCKFSDEIFVQINSTAMGIIFAPTCAILSTGYNQFGVMLGQFILENWCQFLDDCETTLDKTKTDP